MAVSTSDGEPLGFRTSSETALRSYTSDDGDVAVSNFMPQPPEGPPPPTRRISGLTVSASSSQLSVNIEPSPKGLGSPTSTPPRTSSPVVKTSKDRGRASMTNVYIGDPGLAAAACTDLQALSSLGSTLHMALMPALQSGSSVHTTVRPPLGELRHCSSVKVRLGRAPSASTKVGCPSIGGMTGGEMNEALGAAMDRSPSIGGTTSNKMSAALAAAMAGAPVEAEYSCTRITADRITEIRGCGATPSLKHDSQMIEYKLPEPKLLPPIAGAAPPVSYPQEPIQGSVSKAMPRPSRPPPIATSKGRPSNMGTASILYMLSPEPRCRRSTSGAPGELLEGSENEHGALSDGLGLAPGQWKETRRLRLSDSGIRRNATGLQQLPPLVGAE